MMPNLLNVPEMSQLLDEFRFADPEIAIEKMRAMQKALTEVTSIDETGRLYRENADTVGRYWHQKRNPNAKVEAVEYEVPVNTLEVVIADFALTSLGGIVDKARELSDKISQAEGDNIIHYYVDKTWRWAQHDKAHLEANEAVLSHPNFMTVIVAH